LVILVVSKRCYSGPVHNKGEPLPAGGLKRAGYPSEINESMLGNQVGKLNVETVDPEDAIHHGLVGASFASGTRFLSDQPISFPRQHVRSLALFALASPAPFASPPLSVGHLSGLSSRPADGHTPYSTPLSSDPPLSMSGRNPPPPRLMTGSLRWRRSIA